MKKKHIIFSLLVLFVVILFVAGIRIYSVSVIGTVTWISARDNGLIDVEVEKSGLVDCEMVTLSYHKKHDLKEGDRVWAICDSFMNLSEPPQLFPKYLIRF